MIKTLQRALNLLGPARVRALFILLAVTGLLSLVLNAVISTGSTSKATWVAPLQSALALIFLIGALLIVLSRLPRDQWRRALIIVGPAVVAFGLALFFPSLWLLFVPTAVGWLVIAYLASQGRMRREYQEAIKFLRQDQYDKAIAVMSGLIKAEPTTADHYRFRAELYRLAGTNRKARADYEKVILLEPKSAVGYNGCSELAMQEGDYQSALKYAQRAYELEPDQWVAAYNLGMVADRLELASVALTHLDVALKAGIPDSRHRLLTHLWLARAALRQNDRARAEVELAAMKREQTGLSEWQTLFESPQAAVLREVLNADVALAERLIQGTDADPIALLASGVGQPETQP